MKLCHSFVTVFLLLSFFILQFIFCTGPVKPDFPPHIRNDKKIITEGTREPGTKFTMYIDAISDNPINYKWYKNNIAIENAQNARFVIESLSTEDEGVYKCEVSAVSASDFSNPYELKLIRNDSISIQQDNKSPEFKPDLPHNSYQIDEADTLEILFDALDEESNSITYKLKRNTLPRPETVSFDTKSKTLLWTSKQGDTGKYEIVIEVSDGKLATEKVIDIGVGKVNLPPGISCITVKPGDTIPITEGHIYNCIVEISDPNKDDKPTFDESENMPEGATFDKKSGEFIFAPDYGVSNSSSDTFFEAITFRATDNAAENPLQTKFVFHIIVRDLKYLITAEAGSGGTIDPSGTISVEPDTYKSFKVTPNPGWKIKQVLVNDINEGTAGSYNIHVQHDMTIKATFKKINISYPLNISSDENGKTEPSGMMQATSDSTIRIIAYPNTGYQFVKWEILEGNPEITKLSTDTFEVRINNETTKMRASYLKKVKTKYIAVYGDVSFFLKMDNTLWAAGDNTGGKFGNGQRTSEFSPVQVFTDVDSIIGGDFSNFVIKNDKTLWATGWNIDGQLGLGDTLSRISFTRIPGIKNIKGIEVSEYHTLIIKADGTLWAAGLNQNYALSLDGWGKKLTEFTQIPFMTNVVKVCSGYDYTIVLRSDNTIWCVGRNYKGQLGLGDNEDRKRFVKMTGMSDVADIFTNEHGSTFILKKDHSLWATGDNEYGQLGDGTLFNRNSPVKMMDDVIAVSQGGYHTLILKADYTLWTAGNNEFGQLGNNSFTNSSTLIKVFEDVKYVSAGKSHSIIMKNDNTIWGTGSNSCGQLGIGDKRNRSIFTKIPF